MDQVKISPDVSGEITELFFDEGDSVKRGDLLLKISDLLDYDFFKCFSEWREQRDKTTTKSSSWKE